MTKKSKLLQKGGMLTLTKTKPPKISALRNIEYYDFKKCLTSCMQTVKIPKKLRI